MPCCDKEGLKKGPWTPEEDQKLIDYIQKINWRTLPKKAGLQRCGKSCRLRWTNYLRPDIKRGRFSFEEEDTIIQLHSILGNKWSAMAAKLPGRTDNEIKNYWNTHIRKRLLRMGIDPVTHRPRLDLLDPPSTLLNLHTFLNPELLILATSLAFSQNGISNPHTQNHPHNQIIGQIKLPIQNIPSFDGTEEKPNLEQNKTSISSFEAVQSGFQVSDHVGTEPSFNCYTSNHAIPYPSSDNSGFVSTPCSSPVDSLNGSGFAYLISNSSTEDEMETYFGNIVNKFDSPNSGCL